LSIQSLINTFENLRSIEKNELKKFLLDYQPHDWYSKSFQFVSSLSSIKKCDIKDLNIKYQEFEQSNKDAISFEKILNLSEMVS